MRGDRAQWWTNAPGEGIRGSKRIDTAGNVLFPCSCNTPWLPCFMSHAPGSRRIRCFARAREAGGPGEAASCCWELLSCPALARRVQSPGYGSQQAYQDGLVKARVSCPCSIIDWKQKSDVLQVSETEAQVYKGISLASLHTYTI